jgi:hypothetical protein
VLEAARAALGAHRLVRVCTHCTRVRTEPQTLIQCSQSQICTWQSRQGRSSQSLFVDTRARDPRAALSPSCSATPPALAALWASCTCVLWRSPLCQASARLLHRTMWRRPPGVSSTTPWKYGAPLTSQVGSHPAAADSSVGCRSCSGFPLLVGREVDPAGACSSCLGTSQHARGCVVQAPASRSTTASRCGTPATYRCPSTSR